MEGKTFQIRAVAGIIENRLYICISGIELFGLAAFVCKQDRVVIGDIRRRQFFVLAIQFKARRFAHQAVEFATCGLVPCYRKRIAEVRSHQRTFVHTRIFV